MNGEEVPIALLVVLGASALYFGFEVDRRRKRLHAIFDTFDKQESRIAWPWRRWSRAASSSPTRLIAQA